MHICFVRHRPNGKLFLFECEKELRNQLSHGDFVVVDTKFGNTIGIVETCIGTCTPECYETIIEACGAELPLKKVLRKYVKPIVTRIDEIPQEFVEQIRQEERNKIILELQGRQQLDLPF